ncbi:MAG: cytochrome c oxidase accessory protein CcoG [Bacteroidota bacterium]|nr:cytochrome c oxidase accessory protein CcoG [Bacteroidota bacterium]
MTSDNNIEHDESFRDSVATISKEGRRNYINPKKPHGKLYTKRTIFSIFYLIVFFTLPFIYVNDEPLLMINILERKFILFGAIFWPQDFFIFGLGMVTFVVFIVLFTVVFGRIFCGWACPQTIFMEMVFRKIEYWIDGDSTQQKQLRSMPWKGKKIAKRAFKFVAFFIISFIICTFFLSYLIGMKNIEHYVLYPAENLGSITALFFFSWVFFFVYWWFREQACIVVCPYGRLQGVLLDKNSIVVAYDYKRGEPRGKIKKEDPTAYSDCIDCAACVRVCPTGIDIRNGTQLECVNCTACIDACDDIMESIHKPKGLVRYASENSISNGVQLKFTTRIKAYTVVLTLLISLLVFLVASREDIGATLMRVSGMTYQTLPDGRISNLYNLKLLNKTHKEINIFLKLENMDGEVSLVGSSVSTIKKADYTHLEFFVKLKRGDLKSWKTKLIISILDTKTLKKIKTLECNFLGPEIYN